MSTKPPLRTLSYCGTKGAAEKAFGAPGMFMNETLIASKEGSVRFQNHLLS